MSLARVMIAAPASGSGKTLVTCGIIQALVNRGMKVSSFKCGPDYIDPTFHSRVIGARSRNLDCFFCADSTLRYLFTRSAEPSDISVIEGVMGFYDGIRASVTEGSSYDVSQKLEAPVVLLVNARGSSTSCIPVIKGFKEFRENRMEGVILNNMNASLFPDIKRAVEGELGLKVIGYVPKLEGVSLESRHLGLVMPDEIASLRDDLNRVAATLEETLDIDMLIGMARAAPPIAGEAPAHGVLEEKVRVGFALDDAFCFNYEDNIALLEECGAEIVYFSPINDSKLPEGISGLILSGGYPELHCAELSANRQMLADIKEKIAGGMPCLAECGGFMYLHRVLKDRDGKAWPMVGVVDGESADTGKLTRFGYVSLSSSDPDSIIAGGAKGHEFHYWDSTANGDSWNAVKTSGKAYRCGHEEGSLAAGFPHLYYYSNPDAAYRFLLKCQAYSNLRSDVDVAEQVARKAGDRHGDGQAEEEHR